MLEGKKSEVNYTREKVDLLVFSLARILTLKEVLKEAAATSRIRGRKRKSPCASMRSEGQNGTGMFGG